MARSVIQIKKECYFCKRTSGLHLHHILYGSANRKLSEKYGFTVWLCADHHTNGPDAIHRNPNGINDLYLKRLSQRYYEMVVGSRMQFIKEFGRNYLDLED